MSKVMTISQAMHMIESGEMIAIGGNVLHRAPMALVRELVRQQKRDLKIVKTAGAMDVDLLCFGGCVASVDAGFVSYETEYSLANHYRKAVQNGQVKGNEHACYTVISALRAASAGIPFMPVKGLEISDLIDANGYFERIGDPFTGELVTVVQALRPDVAIIHVHEVDEHGNGYMEPPFFDDLLMARASKKVILSTEQIVSDNTFACSEKKAQIPHFMVDAIVKVEKGAAPCSCLPFYDIDRLSIDKFKQLATAAELERYLAEYKQGDGKG